MSVRCGAARNAPVVRRICSRAAVNNIEALAGAEDSAADDRAALLERACALRDNLAEFLSVSEADPLEDSGTITAPAHSRAQALTLHSADTRVHLLNKQLMRLRKVASRLSGPPPAKAKPSPPSGRRRSSLIAPADLARIVNDTLAAAAVPHTPQPAADAPIELAPSAPPSDAAAPLRESSSSQGAGDSAVRRKRGAAKRAGGSPMYAWEVHSPEAAGHAVHVPRNGNFEPIVFRLVLSQQEMEQVVVRASPSAGAPCVRACALHPSLTQARTQSLRREAMAISEHFVRIQKAQSTPGYIKL